MSREFWCYVLRCIFWEWHLFEMPAMFHIVYANAFRWLGLRMWSVLGKWGRWRPRLLHQTERERTRRPDPGAEANEDLVGSELALGPMLRPVERRARTAEIPCCCHEARQHRSLLPLTRGWRGLMVWRGLHLGRRGPLTPRRLRDEWSSAIGRVHLPGPWSLGGRADRLDRDCSSRRCGANPLDAFLRETESGEEEQPEEDPLDFGSSGDEISPARATTHAEDSQTHASSAHDTGHAETELSSSPSWPSFDQEDDGLGHEPQSKD
eukprot:s140_g14.t1